MTFENHNVIVKLLDQTKAGSRSLEKNLDRNKKKADAFRKSMKNIQQTAKNMSIGLAATAVAVGAVGFKMLSAASDAEETQSKFNVVFAGMSEEANKWSEDFANSVGRGTTEIKKFTSGLADVLKPMGFQTDAAADLSQNITKLALDVASFNNRQDADVIHAFTSALTGERESLKTLGIVITEADVKQEAYRLGVAKVGQELSKEAKALATSNLLFKNSKDAQGDLMRTQDSFENQVKSMKAAITDLSEGIGAELIPLIKPLVTFVKDLAKKFNDLSPRMKKTIAAVIAGTVAIAGIGAVITGVIAILPGIVAGVSALGAVVAALTGPIGIVIAAIGLLVVAWKKNFLGIQDFTKKSWENIKTTAKNGVENTKKFIALGWKDRLKVIAIGAKGSVKLWVAMGKDILRNVVVLFKKMLKGFGLLFKALKDVDWAAVWKGFATSALKIFNSVGKAVMDWGRSVWKNVKKIFTGGEGAEIKFKLPEFSEETKKQFAETFQDIMGAEEFGFKNTAEAMREIGGEMDKVLKKGGSILENRKKEKAILDATKTSIAPVGAPSTTSFDAEAFRDKFKIDSSSVQGGAKAIADLGKAISGLSKGYNKTYLSARDDLKKLENDHAKTTAKIRAEVEKLQASLRDLEAAYKKSLAGLDQSLGSSVVEQEEKIKSLKKELAKEEDAGERGVLKAQLQEEEAALRAFLKKSSGLEDEIAEARRVNALTDFERTIENIDSKRAAETAEFEKKKLQIQEEILIQQKQLDIENALFLKKRKMFNETLAVFEGMVDGIGSASAVMRKNMNLTVDSMKLKLEELKRTLQEIKSLTAPVEGPDKRSLADVGKSFGAADPTSQGVFTPRRAFGGRVGKSQTVKVGERGTEFFRPDGPGTIIPNKEIGGNSINLEINLNIDKIDSVEAGRQLLRDAEKLFTRKLELFQKGIS